MLVQGLEALGEAISVSQVGEERGKMAAFRFLISPLTHSPDGHFAGDLAARYRHQQIGNDLPVGCACIMEEPGSSLPEVRLARKTAAMFYSASWLPGAFKRQSVALHRVLGSYTMAECYTR
jgi:hypothetical protein